MISINALPSAFWGGGVVGRRGLADIQCCSVYLSTSNFYYTNNSNLFYFFKKKIIGEGYSHNCLVQWGRLGTPGHLYKYISLRLSTIIIIIIIITYFEKKKILCHLTKTFIYFSFFLPAKLELPFGCFTVCLYIYFLKSFIHNKQAGFPVFLCIKKNQPV